VGAIVTRNPKRDELIRVRIASRSGHQRPGPIPLLQPLAGQQSHQIAFAAQADGLARIPIGTGELPIGTEVSYLPIDVFAAGRD
jgi:molybdopterin biosynthesis enzyme